MKNIKFQAQKGGLPIWLFIFILWLAGIAPATAQKALVQTALSKYGIDDSIIEPANIRLPNDRAFDLKESSTTAGKTKVTLAKFNPSAAEREKWTVVSVDGKAPSLYEINTFRNARKKPPVDKPDDATYRIESETDSQLVISYKLDATLIPKDAMFLKDCRAVITVYLKSKQLRQLQLVNEKPVKIGPLMATRFFILTKYQFNQTAGRYFPIHDSLEMEATFIGKKVSTQMETVYSNYR